MNNTTIPRPRTSRSGAPAFEERWDNSKCLIVGHWAGQGWSFKRIAQELQDGTSAESIRSRLQKVGIYALDEHNEVSVVVHLTVGQRSVIQQRADQRGLSIGEYIRRLAVCGSVNFATYDQIVPAEQFY